MERETKERTVKERKVVKPLGCMMKEGSVNMEEIGLRDRIIIPTITYVNGTWMWNDRQRSRI